MLARVAGGYRFQTHPDSRAYVERFVLEGQHARLSGPALETLAIVAYKQPISRGQISAIRGVNVEATLHDARRSAATSRRSGATPARAPRCSTAPRATFLERLGLDSLDDLPPLGDFVPDASVVEALERGLRMLDDPSSTSPASDADAERRPPTATTAADAPANGERLQKVLARAGLGSRRACEELIADGPRHRRRRGRGARATRRSRRTTRIALDGVPVVVARRPRLLPAEQAGRVRDAPRAIPQGRPTVLELVPDEPRVFPVGRLDFDTEGLLVLTNDGELAQLLTHPSHGVEKTYLAEVEGVPTPATLARAARGRRARRRRRPRRRACRSCSGAATSAAVEIVIHEGRNRQVRRMCDAVGHPVRRLVRTRIGPLHDRRLAPGEWRPLSAGRGARALRSGDAERRRTAPERENAPG